MTAQLRKASTSGSNKTAGPRKTASGGTQARVCVGAIAAAHGIKGEVKIKTFTADPLSIGAYGPVSDEAGARSFRLTHLRAPGGAAGDSVVLARLEGVNDRNDAEALRGLRLYVARDALPAPEADEYYHHDLIGLAVVLASGERLGKVEAVHNFGASDLLEVARDGASSVMVPFTNAIVPTVDLAGGKVVIDPPEGLFDEGPVEREDGGDEEPAEDENGEEAGKP